ncbi:prepilin-type N-terminal cleavage/methylation domain-containing protein [Neobacillus niacini]|uniref:prepilin-type N-terminal cleavage/methylation domain-containing protein n=1 Tax=Neobacillus niacini TaxID=86668 RepID=UPI002860715E|nr:prepilin-type N-terminal cleavage/methylation domain-containing protein [Neobacillus niacini]MDR7077911.1 prepilin-type N-terminal cleavage/methylation domain-containing protein [Neobacillus niacini]
MENFKSEKGVTLIEVIASIAILSIILISFMGIFPQMGIMNKNNEDKTQAVSTTKEILIHWQDSENVKSYLTSPTQTSVVTSDDPNLVFIKNDGGYYYFETVKDIYRVNIKIANSPNTNSSKIYKLHSIQIELFNNKNNLVGETYGFIKR